MLVFGLEKKAASDPSVAADAADAKIVASMRLILAISVLSAIFIDPSGDIGVQDFTWVVFFSYFLHSLLIWCCLQLNQQFSQSKLGHWLDVFWSVLIVVFTGGANNFFFLMFFFAILTSSFRWGLEEGARVTFISAVLFVAVGLGLSAETSISDLVLRTTFLLAFGYMSAYWGETRVGLTHRLALLRDVSRLSNPRFGVDHTVTKVLEKTRLFFNGSSCNLVMSDKESGSYSIRTVKDAGMTQSVNAEPIGSDAALQLMAPSRNHIVNYNRRLSPVLALFKRSRAYDTATNHWVNHDAQTSDGPAELLGARFFISAPMSLKRGECRIYVSSNEHAFSKADALFLSHIVAQAFPVIENIELVDRMASDAASRERQKIALDMHDTAIQPYIGLKLALSALLSKASADNPLTSDLENLTAKAVKVIEDLRRFAGAIKNKSGQSEPIFLVTLQQQAAQVRDFYGINIVVSVVGDLEVGDRLTAEALQIVREGLNNICKHTHAQQGSVKLQCVDGWLRIEIENEGPSAQSVDFRPKSIMERATELGGRAEVKQKPCGSTAIHVEIPI